MGCGSDVLNDCQVVPLSFDTARPVGVPDISAVPAKVKTSTPVGAESAERRAVPAARDFVHVEPLSVERHTFPDTAPTKSMETIAVVALFPCCTHILPV